MNVELKDVSKTISRKLVLDGVTASFSEGEISAIVGMQGSGKSALLRVLAGAISLDSGQVTYGGFVKAEPGESVFYLPHTPPFLGDESGLRNISIFLTNYGKGSDASVTDRVMDSLDLFELTKVVEGRVDTLSEVQAWCLGFVIANVVDAPIWLLDQPFVSTASALMKGRAAELLQNAAKAGRTVIYSEDSIDVSNSYLDHICILNRGSVYSKGSPYEIYELAETDHLVSTLIRVG